MALSMGNATRACYRSGGACTLIYDAVQAITLDRPLDSIQTVPHILLDLICILADAPRHLTWESCRFQFFHFKDFEPFPILLERQGFVWEKFGAPQVPEDGYSKVFSSVANVRAIE